MVHPGVRSQSVSGHYRAGPSYLSVALTLPGLPRDFFPRDSSLSGLSDLDLFLPDLAGLRLWLRPCSAGGAGVRADSVTRNIWGLAGTWGLDRICLSNPPGNFSPNILTTVFIFSTALVDR